MDACGLAERYVPLARSIARRRAVNHQDFEDVYSDALCGLARAARRYEPPRAFGPYARKFIVGAIHQGRRDRSGRRNGQVHLPPILVPLEDVHAAPEPDELLVESQELWGFVDELPDFEAAVVRLYYVQDLPQTEIAVMLGVNQMQVSRLLVRARTRLRERIGS